MNTWPPTTCLRGGIRDLRVACDELAAPDGFRRQPQLVLVGPERPGSDTGGDGEMPAPCPVVAADGGNGLQGTRGTVRSVALHVRGDLLRDVLGPDRCGCRSEERRVG